MPSFDIRKRPVRKAAGICLFEDMRGQSQET